MTKPRVIYFQRKPHTGFSFSIEAIFEDLRKRLAGEIDSEVRICPLQNTGWFSKLVNLLEAFFRQGKGIKHITGEVHFLNLLWPKKHGVLTIHDCGMLHRKQGLARKLVQWLYLSGPLQHAAVVTTVSAATRDEINRFSGIRHPDIRVIPVPLAPVYQARPKPFHIHCPTILHVGLASNKNFFRLLEALSGITCTLHIIGELKHEHYEALQKYKVKYSNSYSLTQEEMFRAYQHCDMLAFVSTFEGFGMPIIEAQAVGRPVLSSNLSSMPEVAGGAACLVDPYEVTAIRTGLKQILSDSEFRASLIAKGYENVKRFEPERIAKQYLEIYQSLNH